ncbi:hypothetical protein [Mycolicibacterium sp.]|uniref:hypothetical protein n=1 Tax=Mycolicibacterium sp. TaxID=2320850 RepID=UPI0037C5199B
MARELTGTAVVDIDVVIDRSRDDFLDLISELAFGPAEAFHAIAVDYEIIAHTAQGFTLAVSADREAPKVYA